MNRRNLKIFIIIVSIAIIVSLISLLIIVPVVFGSQFVSVSFQFYKVIGPGHPTLEIVDVNGDILQILYVGLIVNITNSYFFPVQVRYNGFDNVMLIYNRTVDRPADVVTNKDFLVWGAFEGVFDTTLDDRINPNLGNRSGYYYYVARKDLSNYTKTIGIGTLTYPMFEEAMGLPYWAGQDLNGHPILPGTYYIYCVAYGKVAGPLNLTVTSVL